MAAGTRGSLHQLDGRLPAHHEQESLPLMDGHPTEGHHVGMPQPPEQCRLLQATKQMAAAQHTPKTPL